MTYSRALIKLSGEALMGEKPYGIDPEIVQSIAKDVSKVVENGTQIAIVVGGGNIFRGLKGSAAGMDRATADYVGMLATVMNAITLQVLHPFQAFSQSWRFKLNFENFIPGLLKQQVLGLEFLKYAVKQ